jgi:hypothetical protein
MIRVRRPLETTPSTACQALLPHQASDALA